MDAHTVWGYSRPVTSHGTASTINSIRVGESRRGDSNEETVD